MRAPAIQQVDKVVETKAITQLSASLPARGNKRRGETRALASQPTGGHRQALQFRERVRVLKAGSRLI